MQIESAHTIQNYLESLWIFYEIGYRKEKVIREIHTPRKISPNVNAILVDRCQESSRGSTKVIDTVGVFKSLVEWHVILALDSKSIFRDAGMTDNR